MRKDLKWKAIIILGVIAFSSFYALPLKKRINLGLDLQGGMHLVLKVDTEKVPEEARKGAADRALEVIRNRIDQFGVKEPSILLQGEDHVVVQLPGVTERQRAIDLIGKTALLEFKLVSDDAELLKAALDGGVPEGYELKYGENNEPLLLHSGASLTGDALINAGVQFDQSHFNEPIVEIELNSQGARKFARITGENVGRRLAIVLDGKVQSAPRINERIPQGKAVITGRFDQNEANDLAIILRAGALPAPLYIEEERTVGPLLGQDSIRRGINATLIGGTAVFVFILLYYLFAGIVANIALFLNFLIILGAMGYFHSTLTLPGIAGIILTLGMAIDANVLINERIREELHLGRPLRTAVSLGYDRAFSAIFDSNLTTLIAAFLLFQFGTGPIRGFAVTLSIGLIASMFTAIVVTRTILEYLIETNRLNSLKMLKLIKDTKIDFIGKRKICYLLSIIVVGLGLFFYISKGRSAYGIDFTGGQIQEYSFAAPIKLEDLRRTLDSAGIKDASIQQFKGTAAIIIKTAGDTEKEVSRTFKEKFPDNPFDVLRIERVGPSVGALLRKKALGALAWAMVGILIYVAFRFKHFNFAVAGVIALLHDVLVACGLMVLTGRPIDLLIVTALLTIAGYSINDTIVIYDRVREISRAQARKLSLKEIINLAVNQTLGRTLLTSSTAIMVVLSIFLFGGEVLRDFAFCLLVGFVSGVYSTVYIASPLVLAWQGRPATRPV